MKFDFQKIIFILTFFCLTLLNFSLVSVLEAATITDAMQNALSGVNLPAGGQNVEATAQTVVGKIINVFLSLFGIIFLSLMIYGGYKWLMASGREEELKSAKDIIRQAVIGFIIVLAAYAISYFVASSLQQATS